MNNENTQQNSENKKNNERVNQQREHERVNYSNDPQLRVKTNQKIRDAIVNGKERENYFYIGFDVELNPDESSNIKADIITGFDQNLTTDLVHLIVKTAKDMGFDKQLFFELIILP